MRGPTSAFDLTLRKPPRLLSRRSLARLAATRRPHPLAAPLRAVSDHLPAAVAADVTHSIPRGESSTRPAGRRRGDGPDSVCAMRRGLFSAQAPRVVGKGRGAAPVEGLAGDWWTLDPGGRLLVAQVLVGTGVDGTGGGLHFIGTAHLVVAPEAWLPQEARKLRGC